MLLKVVLVLLSCASRLSMAVGYCHGGTLPTDPPCYCNPNQKPPPMCVYNGGGHPPQPCPQCGTSNCTCPLAPTPTPPTPTPPTPTPPTPPSPGPTPPGPTPPGPTPVPDSCFAVTGIDYKFAPGQLFPTTPTYPHGMRPVDTAAQCCDMCKSFKNCSFWTYENGGTAAKPTCYQYKQACCLLKTEAAAGQASHGGHSISGSMKPITRATCRNGTDCGGTNEWTKWHDTTLPNSTCNTVWCNPGTMPYPPSKDLVGWEFKSGCNSGYGSGGVTGASADTWFPTWAADNVLYTGFTDGNVFDDITHSETNAKSEGSHPLYTVTHGQAAIVGDDPFELNITKVKSFNNQSAWPYGGRFPGGSLVYKGTWFYGTYYVPQYPEGPLVGGLLGPLADFRHSLDMGETWIEPLRNATSDSDNLFGESGDDPLHGKPASGPARVKFGTPHWVDFGQELEHSPDGKAYLVAHGATSPDSTEMWMLGDQVYLARVTPTVENVDDRSKWEFYAGGHGSAAKWVAGDVTKATPLVEFTNHTGCTTMTYFPAIKKYIMSINTASHYPTMDGGNFDTWFLESDDITGPWSLVTWMKNFGPQIYFSNFISKFTAKQVDTTSKTLEAFLMFSANYDPGHGGSNPPNSQYSMNLQQSRFTISDAFAARLEAGL